MIIIPLNSAGARAINIDLESDIGVFTFRSYWNSTMQTWNLDIVDGGGNDVILGLPMVVGIDLLKAHPAIGDRIGQLRVISATEENNRGEETMGTSADLIHFAPGEFEGLFTAPDFLPVQVVDVEDVTQPNIC